MEDDPIKKEKLKNKILDETLDFYFSRFEKQLMANNGHFGKEVRILNTPVIIFMFLKGFYLIRCLLVNCNIFLHFI